MPARRIRQALRRFVVAGLMASVLAAVPLVGAPGLRAQTARSVEAPARELLNSERIELAFGSYGIEVLESDATMRVSNLYSGAGAQRVCRTFAVVRYPAVVAPELAAEHAAIVAGGSIGATFAARGWTVIKTHRHFGEIDATPRLRALMGDTGARRLAVHVYAFDVVREGARFAYAAIAEVHHPEYLEVADLHGIYGAGVTLPAAPDGDTRALLELVAAKSRGP